MRIFNFFIESQYRHTRKYPNAFGMNPRNACTAPAAQCTATSDDTPTVNDSPTKATACGVFPMLDRASFGSEISITSAAMIT